MLQLKHGNMKILYKYVQFWLYYRPNVKLSFFVNNIFYKSNNLFLIKMYNLKKILINFDDLIIRYHLIKFYSSAILILFLIEIKNFTYKFHLYLFIIWQSFLPKYLLFPLTHNFSLSKSFKYTS